MSNNFVSLHIDKAKQHILTKITKSKKGTVTKESDHNVLITEFNNINALEKVNDKLELYNLKNIECQGKFREYTSNTNMLSSVFDSNEDINVLAKRFIKMLDGCIKLHFKKVRVSSTKPTESEQLYSQMHDLQGKTDQLSKDKLAKVIENIANHAERKYVQVYEELRKMKPDGQKIYTQKFWKLKKKICPKNKDPSAAMLDKSGNLLTNDAHIKKKSHRGVYREASTKCHRGTS